MFLASMDLRVLTQCSMAQQVSHDTSSDVVNSKNHASE
jgi:hypothetical protein